MKKKKIEVIGLEEGGHIILYTGVIEEALEALHKYEKEELGFDKEEYTSIDSLDYQEAIGETHKGGDEMTYFSWGEKLKCKCCGNRKKFDHIEEGFIVWV